MSEGKKNYAGSCHCGSVSFRFVGPLIDRVMRCDCSICRRKGTMYSTFVVPPEAMEITDAKGTMKTYRFATMSAQHHFCDSCGIHTFVETRLKPGHYRINLGCLEGLDPLGLPETIYDGKSL